MGHFNFPNNNEDDVVSDSEVGERDGQDQHDYENDGAHRYLPSPIWRQWSPVPLLFAQPPRNVFTIRPRTTPTAHMRPQSYLPFHCRRMPRPPPIGVCIPIILWHQIRRPPDMFVISLRKGIRYRGHCLPAYDNHAQNYQFSEGQPPRVENYPRSPSTTPPPVYHENSTITNSIYHPYARAVRPSYAMEVTLGPTSSLTRRKSRQPRKRRCRMNRVDLGVITVENPQQVENNEEEEDKYDVEDVQPCKAYKDLHYKNDSDDDDNNRSQYALPNM